MTKYHFTKKLVARTISGVVVMIPDEVYLDQRAYDHETFPVIDKATGKRKRGMLRGYLYGLHTSGTGDIIVGIV